MFIQTEATPNPATLKFLPGRTVLEGGTLDLRDSEEATQSPLAERLFAIPGISGVFFGSDFIAVTKTAIPCRHGHSRLILKQLHYRVFETAWVPSWNAN